MLTLEELKMALPPHLSSAATQEYLDLINTVSADPEQAKAIRDNFVSYTQVLKEGKFKTEDYLNAVAYVSYKLMGYTNQEAYSRTFPQRYQSLVARKASTKDIAAYVSAYHRNKLIALILEQSLTPSWVLNQDVYQDAINEQHRLMLNAKSEMVRATAANSLLTHLKPPEKKQIEIDIGLKETSGMAELRKGLTELAEQQRALIEQGASTRDIAYHVLVPRVAQEIEDAVLIEGSAQEVDP